MPDKIDWQHTAKHGIWVKIAEMGSGIRNRPCLDGHLNGANLIAEEVAAWEGMRRSRIR